MDLPAAVQSNPTGADYWDTQLFHQALQDAGVEQNVRTTERQLEKAHWLPAVRKPEDIQDELQRPLVQLVVADLEARAKRKRLQSLVVQTASMEDGRTLLLVSDGRSGRRWRYLDQGFTTDDLLQTLGLLVNGKAALLWPHGSITANCRDIVAAAKTHDIVLPDNVKVTFALTAYHAILTPNPGQRGHLDRGDEMTHLDRLEAESIHIIREVIAQAKNPVMLYSVGKDSSVMLHLARKAFYPSPPPFPLMHVDTRWKFQAMYEFRDRMAEESGMELIVHINPEGVAKDMNPFDHGSALHTDVMKTQGLKQALDKHGFDVAFGGARRDEEKSRAKERVFSFRTEAHRWDPKNQRPELWNLYNGYKRKGESIRVFPLSNWTELDIWEYIYRENIPIVPLYFAAERPVVERDGMLMMVDDDRMRMLPGEEIQSRLVRFRTLGCYPLTGAVDSDADNLSSIVLELLHSRTSERQGRAIDSDSSGSMEKKKQEGYF
jgi:sulfate adenylyltransferase subunit 2